MPEQPEESYGKYEASPLPAGYGVTLGNALRRVLLSSLEGAAVTSVQVHDVYHEFGSHPGRQGRRHPDRAQRQEAAPQELRAASGPAAPRQVGRRRGHRGRHRAENADIEIVNPDQHLLTLDSDDVTGRDRHDRRARRRLPGRRAAEPLPIGVIPVDAIFSPVRKVNYTVENTRVGQMTNYDKLTIEIETDGTIAPEEALSQAAEILVHQFSLFTTAGKPVAPAIGRHRAARPSRPNMLDMPIEELDLPMRAYNSLKRNNIVKVGQLLQLSDEDLLRMRNFGKKSLDEMKERLRMRGFLPPRPRRARRGHGRRRRWTRTTSRCGRGRVMSMAQPHRRPQAGPQEPARAMALYKNLIVAVLRYEQIKTTEARAKEVRGQVERMITLAKRWARSARAAAIVAELPDEPLVIDKLFNEIAPRYADRTSGTRASSSSARAPATPPRWSRSSSSEIAPRCDGRSATAGSRQQARPRGRPRALQRTGRIRRH